jgi:hypothetical protein
MASLQSQPGLSMFRVGVALIVISSLQGLQWSGYQPSYRTQHQEVDRLCHQVLIPELLGPGAQGAAYGHILGVAMLVRECPGEVATAARQIVVTSKDRGHPCCQSRPFVIPALKNLYTTLYTNQYTFMLSLEVVDPGGSLSMLQLLCHGGETPVRESPGKRQIVVTDDNGASHLTVCALEAAAVWRNQPLWGAQF